MRPHKQEGEEVARGGEREEERGGERERDFEEVIKRQAFLQKIQNCAFI